MRIGIISDTHNQQQRTLEAVRLLTSEGAEVLFHCGDLTEPAMVHACAVLPCYFVLGNNDVRQQIEIRNVINEVDDAVCLNWGGEVELDKRRIALTHGHLPQEIRQLLSANPDYMFSGHSHLAGDWHEGTTRRINPGALHRASQFSVALLDLENDDLQFLKIDR